MPAEHNGAAVTIGIQELITMMASEVARKVGNELRTQEIEPLNHRLDEIEAQINDIQEQLTRRSSWMDGAGDALSKIGWIALAVIEGWHYLKH